MAGHHLVILVHGLWGNSSHLSYIESRLEEQFADKNLTTYRTGSHSGYLTYDGVDVNGKRTTDEILEQTRILTEKGHTVDKFSIIGYSLGGLIARYAIGILYSQGYFDKVEPINFITFCTPHVGVWNPLSNNVSARMFNSFAPYFLAHSGSQMFLKDRIESKPLLVWMADSNSYFFKSLKGFKYRTLYSNVVNDKRTSCFTSAISKSDPYNSMTNTNPARIQVEYLKGYDPTVIDIAQPVNYIDASLHSKADPPPSVSVYALRFLNILRILGSVLLYSPLWFIFFVFSSILERIKLNKRVHTFFDDTSNNLLHLYEYIDVTEPEDEGEKEDDVSSNKSLKDETLYETFERGIANQVSEHQDTLVETVYDAILDSKKFQPDIKTLNLTTDQLFIIDQLNTLNWVKYPVIIRNTRHTHAAAIIRFADPLFDEGRVVISHLVNETFQLF